MSQNIHDRPAGRQRGTAAARAGGRIGRLRVLILGGYGTFGGRLAELLAGDIRLALLIAGRSEEKAVAFAAGLPHGAEKSPVKLDRNDDLEAAFASLDPDIVVDATGPFQAYGERPYRVVEACLARGIDYLDLADGSDFVCGISTFDRRAKDAGTFVLAGVSSFPVLTAAVVRELSEGLDRLDTVTGGIAPSPFARVGENVIRAIAGYAGKPVKLWRDGALVEGHGLTETRRYTIAPPGRLPLRNILFSLVDVPDLQVLHGKWPQLGVVWMGAGPVPEPLHRALILLARLVRWRIIPSLSPFARLFHFVMNRLAWGEDRGGMFVAVTGKDAAGPVERSWHLLAEGTDGPLIPSMACEIVIRHCIDGRRPAAGARDAAGELTLADYRTVFTGRTILTGTRENRPGASDRPLYRRILADACERLPEPIRIMHDLQGDRTAKGVAEVERGTGILARVVAAVIGFPTAGKEVPVEVNFRADGGSESWERVFAGQRFRSVQSEGTGRSTSLLSERFGFMTFALALVVEGDRLRLIPRRWSVMGIPMPMAWGPRSDSYEAVEDGRFRFHVEISHPLTGLIVRYRGWLVPS